jgi:hypothetical protein
MKNESNHQTYNQSAVAKSQRDLSQKAAQIFVPRGFGMGRADSVSAISDDQHQIAVAVYRDASASK